MVQEEKNSMIVNENITDESISTSKSRFSRGRATIALVLIMALAGIGAVSFCAYTWYHPYPKSNSSAVISDSQDQIWFTPPTTETFETMGEVGEQAASIGKAFLIVNKVEDSAELLEQLEVLPGIGAAIGVFGVALEMAGVIQSPQEEVMAQLEQINKNLELISESLVTLQNNQALNNCLQFMGTATQTYNDLVNDNNSSATILRKCNPSLTVNCMDQARTVLELLVNGGQYQNQYNCQLLNVVGDNLKWQTQPVYNQVMNYLGMAIYLLNSHMQATTLTLQSQYASQGQDTVNAQVLDALNTFDGQINYDWAYATTSISTFLSSLITNRAANAINNTQSSYTSPSQDTSNSWAEFLTANYALPNESAIVAVFSSGTFASTAGTVNSWKNMWNTEGSWPYPYFMGTVGFVTFVPNSVKAASSPATTNSAVYTYINNNCVNIYNDGGDTGGVTIVYDDCSCMNNFFSQYQNSMVFCTEGYNSNWYWSAGYNWFFDDGADGYQITVLSS